MLSETERHFFWGRQFCNSFIFYGLPKKLTYLPIWLAGSPGFCRPCLARKLENCFRKPPYEKDSSFGFTMTVLSVIPAITFLIGISFAAYIGKIPEFIVAVYFGASIVTFIAYARDKSAAKQGSWRTKEKTLHLFALAGGWPGAIIAQQKFHHKTKKKSFRAVFWVTAVLNCGGLFWFSKPDSVQKTIDFIDIFLKG